MKTKLIALMVLCLAMVSVSHALNPGTETFTGPAFDLGDWTLTEGGGTFTGTGQYTISDDGTKPVVGIVRIVGSGDFEAYLYAQNLSFGDNSGKLGFEFWDEGSLPNLNAFLLQLYTANGTNYLLEAYAFVDSGSVSILDTVNLAGPPSSVSYKVTWTEATKTWTASYGLDGDPPETNTLDTSGLTYTAAAWTSRHNDIWVDQWMGTGTMTADLDYYEIWPPGGAPTPTPLPTPSPQAAAGKAWVLYQ